MKKANSAENQARTASVNAMYCEAGAQIVSHYAAFGFHRQVAFSFCLCHNENQEE